MKTLRVFTLPMIALMLSLLAVNAHAHSALKASEPAANATVAAADNLSLQFNGAVRLVRLTLENEASQQVQLAFTPSSASSEQFSIPLPALAPGKYTVNWSIIGGDGHAVSESFGFTLDPHAAHAQHEGHEVHADHAEHADHADHAGHAEHQTENADAHAHH